MSPSTRKQKISLIVAGVFLSFLILEGGMRLSAFVLLKIQERQNAASLRLKDTYRILCLGESTTAIGGRDSYPYQLEEILNEKSSSVKFSVINEGCASVNTSTILTHLEGNLDKYRPDMVVAMMGINDHPHTSLTFNKEQGGRPVFWRKFKTYKLLRFMIAHLGATLSPVTVAQPRLENEMPEETRNKIQQYRQRMKENPDEYDNSFRLGVLYLRNGLLDLAEPLLRDVLKKQPYHDGAIFMLGKLHYKRGLYKQAEDLYSRALALEPDNQEVYVHLAQLYSDRCFDYPKAAEMYQKVLAIDPGNMKASLRLADLYYRKQGLFDKAKAILQEYIQKNPTETEGYRVLGSLYREKKEYAKAISMFQKSFDVNPDNELARLQLAELYIDLEDFANAERVLKELIGFNPKNEKAYAVLAKMCQKQNLSDQASIYYQKAESLRSMYYLPMTRHNYWELYKALHKRGIQLVCVQYPVRGIEPLQRIFSNEPGILFVDNQESFKNAIQAASYEDYFTDYFAGDFGHCTRDGNRLLAKNIAATILDHVTPRE